MPFQRVVVGVDFSAASLAAARWVATQLAPRAEIVLVHVFPEPEAPPFVRPYLPVMLETVSEVVPALYGGLRGVTELTGTDRTRIEMLAGSPADGLALAAAECEADLICLGRTRSRRGGARFGATVAQRLLARTRLPVLVVPTAPAAAPVKIAVALDGRPSGRAVAEAAWGVARARAARVEALHVLGPELRGLVRACRIASRDDDAVARAHLTLEHHESPHLRDEAHLYRLTAERITGDLAAVGVPAARAGAHVRVGDPGQEIVAYARASGSDMIVIGRGDEDATGAAPPPSAHGRLPLGSTARLVTWVAPCPVLVVSAASVAARAPDPPPAQRVARWRRRGVPSLDARAAAPRAGFDRPLHTAVIARPSVTGPGGDAA